MIDSISVVMPAYNAAAFVGQAIESILNQTYPNFEFIVIDDGSMDETLSIALGYAEYDRRVKVIHSHHTGLSTALNTAIGWATHQWVARMDADDVSVPYRLERQVQAARNSAGVVGWGAFTYHISSAGKRIGISRVGATTEEEFFRLREQGRLTPVIHATALLRKIVVQRAGGYDPRFDGAEDLDLFERMAEFGPILAIPEPLLLQRMHESSFTMSRFAEQRLLTRYVRARLRARLCGERLPIFEEFGEQYRRCALRTRIRRFLDDSGKLYYRRAGIAFAEGQYLSAATDGLLSAVVNPAYFFPRLWSQKVITAHKYFL